MMRFIAVVVCAWSMSALTVVGQPVIDGSAADPMYGGPLAVQNTEAGFGDSTIGRPDWANGSELDAAYGVVYEGVLHLVLAGNLETNSNKIEIFLDTKPGVGQNRLLGAENPDIDFGALQRMGDDGSGNGLTFPFGFEPDYYVTVKAYGDPTAVYVNYAELYVDAMNPGVGYYLGEGRTKCDTSNGELTGGDPGCPFTVSCTLDNRNVYGVPGGFGPYTLFDDVRTGLELAIPLSAIGNPGSDFSITAFVNGQGHDFVSNQMLGGIGGAIPDNLGEPRTVYLDGLGQAPFWVPLSTPPVGACCAGTSCSITSEAACGGAYQGDNTSCDGNPCDMIPAGRCCIDDGYSGQCIVTTEADCTMQGGSFSEGGTCDGCPCLFGACCEGETCGRKTEADCAGAGGDYVGPFTVCDAATCVAGACCVGEACSVVRKFECDALGGRYMGTYTTCEDGSCEHTIWTPTVAGTMNAWDTLASPMTENPPDSDIFEVTFVGLEGWSRHEFKITDGTWNISLPGANSWAYADDLGELTIVYDANTHNDGWAPTRDRIGIGFDPTSWTAVGDWQGWNVYDPFTAMSPTGGGVYEYVTTGLWPGPHAWKAVFSTTWDAISWDGRSIGASDMSFATGSVNDVVTMRANVLDGTVQLHVLHDCNGNATDDAVDLANCDGSPWCSDCNENFALDVCDINEGTSADINANDVPDECESVGACCLGDLCFEIREDVCAQMNGTYLGNATDCEGRPCGAPCDLPIVDGVLDARYGSPLRMQDTRTQFGDSDLGLVDFANGSELDGAYAYVASNGRLYVFLAGNLESNFNKLEVFFDTRAGGQNKLRGDNPDVDFNGLNRMGDDGSGNGLAFDAGFEADFWLGVTGGNNPYELYVNFAELYVDAEHPGAGGNLGTGAAADRTHGGLVFGDNPDVVLATIDNRNTAGVIGGPGPIGAGEHPQDVTTGIEVSIPLSAVGDPAAGFKFTAFVNGVGHDWVSNQVLGPIGGGDNFGEPRALDLSTVPGIQYVGVPIVPLEDCNSNGVLDECDIADCPVGEPACADCQSNGIPDGCDIDSGASGDCNGNGVPDECDAWTPGDFDDDGDVDRDDYAVFENCSGGPNAPPTPSLAECVMACLAVFDFAPADGDVDLGDFAEFQGAYTIVRECGNGVPEPGEECDDEGESATCDADCTIAECGDGTLNVSAGEECDDGNTNGGDGCSSACLIEPLPDCTLLFNPEDCPFGFFACGATLEGGAFCADWEPGCADSPPSALVVFGETTITLIGDLNRLSLMFSGYQGATGMMAFYDESGVQVDGALLTNGDCFYGGPPPAQTVTFSRPVRSILVIPVGGFVWIDTFRVNPP